MYDLALIEKQDTINMVVLGRKQTEEIEDGLDDLNIDELTRL